MSDDRVRRLLLKALQRLSYAVRAMDPSVGYAYTEEVGDALESADAAMAEAEEVRDQGLDEEGQ